jgi:hypothetical protein
VDRHSSSLTLLERGLRDSTGSLTFERFAQQPKGAAVPLSPTADVAGWGDTVDAALQNISPIYKAYKTISDAKDAKEKKEKEEKAAKEKAATAKDPLEHGGKNTPEEEGKLRASMKKGGVEVPWWVWLVGAYMLAKRL